MSMERITSHGLLRVIESDVRSAFRLLIGLFVIGLAFTGLTVPFALFLVTDKNVRTVNEDCRYDLVVGTHWALLTAFVIVQICQLPFRMYSFSQVFRLGLRMRERQLSRHRLVESFKTVVQQKCWKLNQTLGFLGQYLIPLCGFVMLCCFGEHYQEKPCLMSSELKSRPSSLWSWLMLCIFTRMLLTFVLGYNTVNSELEQANRGATLGMLNKLEAFRFSHSLHSVLEQPSCAICISDFTTAERVVGLPCNKKHIFHKDCVFDWLQRCKKCPLCMLDIDDVDNFKID